MDAPEVALDAPQVFIGSGVIALFMVDPKQLKFANTNTDPERKATVEILVGRDATP
jgi:hypothetical protein